MKNVISYLMICLMMFSWASCKIWEEPPPPEKPWRNMDKIPVSIFKSNKAKVIDVAALKKKETIDIKFEPHLQDDVKNINKILQQNRIKNKIQNNPKPFYTKLLNKKDSYKKVKLTVDFNKVSLNDLIVPFAKILEFSYIIDPKIKGDISLKIDQKMSKREIYQLLQQLLALSNCYCSVDDNKVLKILPLEKISKDNQLTTDGEDGCIAKVVPLNHVSTDSALNTLKNQLKKSVNVIPLVEQNALLLIDDNKSVERLQKMLRLIDKQARREWTTIVFDCPNISASRLKMELEEILPILGFYISSNSATNRKAKKITKHTEVDITALDRLGLLMISAVNDEVIDEVSDWVNLLQRDDIGDVEKIFVYPIVNSRATDLVQALSVVFTTDGKSLSSNNSGSGISAGGGQKGFSSGGTSQSSNFSNNNKNGDNKDVGFASIFDIPVHIFADEINNRLIIRTTPKTYSIVKALLNRIDTTPSQVLLQVLIVEVALTKSTQFGVRFNSLNKGSKILSEVGTNYEGLDPKATNNYGFTAAIANPNNPDEQFAFVKALATRSKVNVISSPQVMVESHAEAKISVGDKVPIVQSEVTNTQSVQPEDSTALVRNIQYIDTGVILAIKPTITKGGLIRVELEQTVSLATTTKSSGIDSPTISERILKTKMSLRDGQTLALGGLIRENVQKNQSTIPGISEIPILSWLLGDNANSIERTELIMLITGTVIKEQTKLEKLVKRYADAVNEIKRFEYEVYYRDDIRDKNEAKYRKGQIPFQ